jgi:hypothetical protein
MTPDVRFLDIRSLRQITERIPGCSERLGVT